MTKDELKAYIESNFSGKLTALDTGRYDLLFEAKKGDLVELARALRDDESLKFDYLCNIGAIDTRERFEIVYSIASTVNRLRLDFKIVFSYDDAEVESVQTVWPAANWYEREIWELYGIDIKNHDNLKRFLLPDDWNQGHPMRKDWDAPDFVRFPEFEV
jgi:NADH:ubiquinone oxidoreductase subunit C